MQKYDETAEFKYLSLTQNRKRVNDAAKHADQQVMLLFTGNAQFDDIKTAKILFEFLVHQKNYSNNFLTINRLINRCYSQP